MGRYIARRIAEVVPTLLILSVLIFLIMRLLPGDPVLTLLGEEGPSDPEQLRIIEQQLGLDRPLPVQYLSWLGGIVQGDWGTSFRLRGTPVSELLGSRLMVTLHLAILSWLLALMLGVTVGVVAAITRNSWTDVVINTVSLAGVATPNFLLGLILILIFAVQLAWLPATGFVRITDDPLESLRHLALPTIALTTGLMAALVRQTRSAMLEVLHQDYIRTARAKGLTPRTVVVKHALKNAMIPIVTISMLQVRIVISGTIIIETMFSIPGMGRLIIISVQQGDFPVLQMAVIVIGLSAIAASLVADLLYAQLDPRIRLA